MKDHPTTTILAKGKEEDEVYRRKVILSLVNKLYIF